MNVFTDLKKKLKDFFCPSPEPTRYELRMKQPARALVWNDEGVLLDTHGADGDHFFEHFTGHIVCFQTECEVKDAAFKFHAGALCFLAGQQPSPGIWQEGALQQNWIEWKEGILLSGHLNCRSWEKGTIAGGELSCGAVETAVVNGGIVNCAEWRGGTVNNGEIRCTKWLCGTFNNGTFRGEWYGGIWNGGTWQGKVLTGDGTFETITNNKKGSLI